MIKRKKTEKYIEDYPKKHYQKRKRQLKVGSIASEIISSIASGVKSIGELLEYLDESGAFDMLRLSSWHERTPRAFHYTRSQLRSGFAHMERNGFVKRKSRQTVFLTEKGIMEVLKYIMKNRHLHKKWDGKWRIITFDIEEITRKDRDYLRRQLKWIGFEELQKSVWIFPYEIRDELKEFMKMCRFEFRGDVRFILADSIQSDTLLRQKFNL